MRFLANPHVFNYTILTLYALSTVRFLLVGSWWDAVYGIGAVLIMASIVSR